jgi:hypothetical protein
MSDGGSVDYADEAGPDPTGSFSDADDSEVSAALSRRIKQIATTTGEWGSSMDEEEMRQPLTGEVGAFEQSCCVDTWCFAVEYTSRVTCHVT